MRAIRVVLLLSPLVLLSGCETIEQIKSVDLSAFTRLWDAPVKPAAAVALRDVSDMALPPDGMQTDDLRAPFGDAPNAVTAANAP